MTSKERLQRLSVLAGVVMVLFAICFFQLVYLHLAFRQTERAFSERMEKLILSSRLVELTSRRTLSQSDQELMRSYARRLAGQLAQELARRAENLNAGVSVFRLA